MSSTVVSRRIAYAIDGSFIGGGHLHVLGLAEAARAHDYQVDILSSAPGPFSLTAQQRGFNVHFLRMGKVPLPAVLNSWRKKISEIKPHVLHLHGGVAGLWGRWSTRRMPVSVVYTIHGIHFIHDSSYLVRYMSLWMERLVQRDNVQVICVCDSDKELAINLKIAADRQINVIHNGINVALKAVPRSPREGVAVGIVGRLVHMKGQMVALEAMASIVREQPSLKLHLIGDGEDRLLLESLVEKLHLQSNVIFRGHQDDVARELSGLDIFLMPSLWEGQPLALMEAMRQDLPIVASRVDGIPEVVRHDVEALLIPPGDPAAIATAILKLIKDKALAERLSAAASKRVVMFDERTCFERTLKVYERMLRNSC